MHKPRWQRRKDERPGEILHAALDVFAARGFAAAKLDEVAARAGVSKGTLYLYFDSKEELFRSVVRGLLLPNVAMAEQRIAAHKGSAAELLRALVLTFGRVITESKLGAIPKLIVAEAANFPDLAKFYYEEVIKRGMRAMGGVLERGAAAGEFRSIPVEQFLPLLMGPLLLLIVWKHGLERAGVPPLPVEAVLAEHANSLLRALAPDQPAQAPRRVRKEAKHER
jgi:AcrR family transcriptional regulator